jgi:hypothetical protein
MQLFFYKKESLRGNKLKLVQELKQSLWLPVQRLCFLYWIYGVTCKIN